MAFEEAWIWSPVLPWRLWMALGVFGALCAVGSCFAVLRQRPLGGIGLMVMRLMMVGAFMMLLAGPGRSVSEQTTVNKPALGVLVDVSGSMRTADMNGRSRWRAVVEDRLNEPALAILRDQFDVRLMAFDASVRDLASSELDASAQRVAIGRQSRYAATLMWCLDDPAKEDIRRWLILGDGHESEGRSPDQVIEKAVAQRRTIDAAVFGGAQWQKDVALFASAARLSVAPGDRVRLAVRLRQRGYGDRAVDVQMQADDQTHLSQTVAFSGRTDGMASFEWLPEKIGWHRLQVSVDPLPDETDRTNNTQDVWVEVRPRHVRVLLLEGSPNWDSRALAQALRNDPLIALTRVTRLRPDLTVVQSSDPQQAFEMPETSAQWQRHDLVMIGGGMEHLLNESSAGALVDHVKAGGRVVFTRGRMADPTTPEGRAAEAWLAPLVPVMWRAGLMPGTRLQLTDAGRDAGLFSFGAIGSADSVLSALPPLERRYPIESLQTGARVMAYADGDSSDQPMVVEMPVGQGDVLMMLGEGWSRWRLLPATQAHLAEAHDRYWSSLVRWMVPDSDPTGITLRLGSAVVRVGDRLQIQVTDRAQEGVVAPDVHVIAPDGAARPLVLQSVEGTVGQWQTHLSVETPGSWHIEAVRSGDKTVRTEAYVAGVEDDPERFDVSADPEWLRRLAEGTGGRLLPPDAGQTWAKQLTAVPDVRRRSGSSAPVWDRGSIMLMLLGWLCLEWMLRRRIGSW